MKKVIFPSTLCLLTLFGCNSNKPLLSEEMSQKIEESVVLVFYNHQGDNGSGFFTAIYELAKLKGEGIPEVLQAATEEDADAVGSQTSLFKWGIPTKIDRANLTQVPKSPVTESLTAEDYYNQGNDLLAQGRYQEAIASYDQSIKIKPDDAGAWNNRGVVLSNLKRYDEALQSYEKAIQIDPNNQTAINNRNNLLERLGR